MNETWSITTHLHIGAPDLPVFATDDPEKAAQLIRDDVKVVVPDFDTAAEVLRLFGLDEEQIKDRIHFAKTGQVLLAR